MQYKTLEDIQRVISKQKPGKVINLFIESYLTGEALAPYFEIEEEYAGLLAQEDVPDVEPVLDEEDNVIAEGYSPNAIRDARIAELEAEYSYLVDPEDDSTIEQRRPAPTLDAATAAELKAGYIKSQFEAALPSGVVDLSLGWPIDCRRSAEKDDMGNMERLVKAAQTAGATDDTVVSVRGADNLNHEVTVQQLQDVVLPEMYNYGIALYQKKWDLEAQLAAATSVEEVLATVW